MKFGGTSVADTDRIRRVARRIVRARDEGHRVVAVLSAMGHETDRLLSLAHEISPEPPGRELDMLLSTGERVANALCAMAIADLGHEAISLTGSQAGIVTDTSHANAKILEVKGDRVRQGLERDQIVLVAGFQGVSTAKDVTTLGRGGSDTTAVALAAALGADCCEIYTDVDGVFTADPRVVPSASKLAFVSYDEMLEMSASGAKVLQLRSVEYARNFAVPLHVRSTFTEHDGTWVAEEDHRMERAIISGVTHATDEAKLSVLGIPDRPGQAARLFIALADRQVNVDMIVQNVSLEGAADISFTVPLAELPLARRTVDQVVAEIDAREVVADDAMAKVSLVGAGMKSHPGIAAKMFQTLAVEGVNIEMISTSPIRISCVIARDDAERAVRALHSAFELGVEAVRREQTFAGEGAR